MKNLKKVLALVLVIAMVMSFAVSASAATFSDADQIAEQNQTAVDVLTALNIIEGFEDGSFKPEASVTRAQVAKMIAVAFNEGDESINDLYRDAPTTLTDISGTWAEGYIKYMANVGYINGYPDGTYKPNKAVTANELCQIMLNILGYDIDTSVSWATAVQAKSFSIGLLKNVSGTVGSECSRQEAAQIIFNALDMDILESNHLGVKIPSGETILTKYLNGYTVDVVVTGNEYADLNSTSPLDEGKTEVNGAVTLNWSTDLDAIGSTYTIWAIQDGAQNQDTVVYAEPSGNTIEEYTGNVTDLSRATSLKIKSTTVDFINFNNETDGYYVATNDFSYEVNIASLTQTQLNLLDSYGYDTTGLAVNGALTVAEKVVSEGDTVTATDLALIRFIYANQTITGSGNSLTNAAAVGAVNYVYADTYTKFVSRYLEKKGTAVDVTANTNGDYTKIIDNDGDGVADYILQTQYAVATVSNIAKNGAVTLSEVAANSDVNIVGNAKVSAYDDVAVGDVVIYAVIDGVAYAEKADSTEITVDKKNYNKITVTSTDGDTYEQSYIDFMIDNAEYEDDIMDLDNNGNYILYTDKFGYVAAATTVATSGNFVLLTDGYYATTKAGGEYAVKAYLDGAIDPYDAKSAGQFVAHATNYNDWGYLKSFLAGGMTTVACYSQDDDTLSLTAVDLAFNKKDVEMVAIDQTTLSASNAALTGTLYTTSSSRAASAYDTTGAAATVNVRSDTVYYYVYQNNGKTIVKTYTGYANAPKVTADDQASIYAVATAVTGRTYYVANVVVVEIGNYTGSGEAIFVYNYPEDVNTLRSATIEYIGSDGKTASISINGTNNGAIDYGPAYLYGSDETGYSIQMMAAADYSKNNFMVGNVTVALGVSDADYATVTTNYADTNTAGASKNVTDVDGSNYYSFSLNNVTSRGQTYIEGSVTEAEAADVLTEYVRVTNGANTTVEDNLVFVSYDARGNVVYAITFDQNVTRTTPAVTNATNVWSGLRVSSTTPTTTVEKAIAAANKIVTDGVSAKNLDAANESLAALQALLDDEKNITVAEQTALTNAKNTLTAAINTYTGAQTAIANQKSASATALDTFIDGVNTAKTIAPSKQTAAQDALTAAKTAVNNATSVHAAQAAEAVGKLNIATIAGANHIFVKQAIDAVTATDLTDAEKIAIADAYLAWVTAADNTAVGGNAGDITVTKTSAGNYTIAIKGTSGMGTETELTTVLAKLAPTLTEQWDDQAAQTVAAADIATNLATGHTNYKVNATIGETTYTFAITYTA